MVKNISILSKNMEITPKTIMTAALKNIISKITNNKFFILGTATCISVLIFRSRYVPGSVFSGVGPVAGYHDGLVVGDIFPFFISIFGLITDNILNEKR